MANRFYTPDRLSLGRYTLDGPEAHHAANVRRLQAGDSAILFNGDGHDYLGQIAEISSKKVIIEIAESVLNRCEVAQGIHLGVAMPKGDRGDFLIEKLVELGATDFTPIHTQRGVVKVSLDKVEKLERAVIEASKQCGRSRLMTIHPPQSFAAWAKTITGQRWLAHPGGAAPGRAQDEAVTVAIGPEGGFTDEEVAHAEAVGWQKITLGPRVLRIETAALLAAALLAQGS